MQVPQDGWREVVSLEVAAIYFVAQVKSEHTSVVDELVSIPSPALLAIKIYAPL